MSSSQELDRVQEKADKTTAELRRTQAELRVTQVSTLSHLKSFLIPVPMKISLLCYLISMENLNSSKVH